MEHAAATREDIQAQVEEWNVWMINHSNASNLSPAPSSNLVCHEGHIRRTHPKPGHRMHQVGVEDFNMTELNSISSLSTPRTRKWSAIYEEKRSPWKT